MFEIFQRSVLDYSLEDIQDIENSKWMQWINWVLTKSEHFRQEVKTCSEYRLEEIFSTFKSIWKDWSWLT